ncbi:MAG TPA: outer membrane beta-barrel protein [Longimicrobium sp.]|nr:outer membrane beta-barrel protein [Longimicrobium sp.]
MRRSLPPVLLFALALALSAAPAPAQHPRAWGVKAGPTVSSIHTELPSEDAQRRRGYAALLFGEWAGSGLLSLVAEAGYVERGYTRDATVGPGDPVSRRLDRRFQYVSLAALSKARVGTLGPMSTYVVAGPRMNALVGSSRGEGVPGSVVWEASAGAGAEGRHAVVEVRYNRGLNNAMRAPWTQPAYHHAVDFVLGWKF